MDVFKICRYDPENYWHYISLLLIGKRCSYSGSLLWAHSLEVPNCMLTTVLCGKRGTYLKRSDTSVRRELSCLSSLRMCWLSTMSFSVSLDSSPWLSSTAFATASSWSCFLALYMPASASVSVSISSFDSSLRSWIWRNQIVVRCFPPLRHSHVQDSASSL